MSLMFTEHALSPVYKYVVSKAYGGTTLMEPQARKVAGKSLTPAAANQAASEIKEDAAKMLIGIFEGKSIPAFNKTNRVPNDF